MHRGASAEPPPRRRAIRVLLQAIGLAGAVPVSIVLGRVCYRAHPNVVEPHRASTYDADTVIAILMGAPPYIQICSYKRYHEGRRISSGRQLILPCVQLGLSRIRDGDIPLVFSPIVGVTEPHHLPEAVAALDLHLTDDEIRTLEEPYPQHGPSWY